MNFIWQDIGGSSDSVNVIYYWMERAVSTVNFLCYVFLISCCNSNSLSFSFIAFSFLLLLLPLFLLAATCWYNCSLLFNVKQNSKFDISFSSDFFFQEHLRRILWMEVTKVLWQSKGVFEEEYSVDEVNDCPKKTVLSGVL